MVPRNLRWGEPQSPDVDGPGRPRGEKLLPGAGAMRRCRMSPGEEWAAAGLAFLGPQSLLQSTAPAVLLPPCQRGLFAIALHVPQLPCVALGF